MPAPWLITRPAPEAESDAQALRARGVAALPFPALEARVLPWDGALAGADLLLLSSPATLEPVAKVYGGWSPRPRVLSLGPATARRAEALGLRVDLEVGGGALALAEAARLEALTPGGPRRALWPTTDRGLNSAEQRQAVDRLAGALELRRVAVASLVASPDLAERFRALQAPARWVFASPSAVEACFSASPPSSALAVICHGASTEAAYRRLAPSGWPAPLPTAGDTVLERILSTNLD